MESLISQDLLQQNPTNTSSVLYTAAGWVAGTYQPSPDKFYQGMLVTQDGQGFGAELHWRLRNKLKRKHPGYAEQPDFFLEPAQWMVYPSTNPLRFRLVIMKPLHSASSDENGSNAEPGQKRELDHFRMVGEIETVAGGSVTICIRRNEHPPRGKEDDPEYQPFILTLEGSVVPPEALGQIWELEGKREGQMLVVVAGRPYQPRKEDLAWIEELHKQHSTAKKASSYGDKAAAANTTLLPFPTLKPKTPGQTPTTKQADLPPVNATNPPPNSPAVPSTPEAKEAPDYPPASPNADISPTTGKMEVVVKLNQFPSDVKTVDKGWKEFEVDADGCIVTVTVKPKMFTALEQAQQTYPSWIAAISGQMGEMTATGFKLDSPSIKVFERKAKDSSQPEETTSKDNLSQPPVTEAQPEPSAPNPTQRPSALHKPDSQQQPSSSANPTARNKQSGQSKTTPPAGQQQQRTISEQALRPQSASPTPKAETTSKRPEQKPGQKQSTASTPLSEPQSEKPAFKVKVNDQIFTGRDSVTLIQRVVRVDGKPVGQAKMVIVLGQPRTMQADGGVSQGRNQAVLTSR
jgi:hypothetical protein